VKLLLTVAHPDDETFGCGSVLAHATTHGVESVVACATRGELGEKAGLAAGEQSPANLGDIREAELRAAAAVLGATRVELLGWLDSGTEGPAAMGSLVAADPDAVQSALASIIEREQPDVVVTLDASDGHRDHAVVRDATLTALETTAWRPSRTYLFCLPQSLLADFAGVPGIGTPDDEITTVVDVSEHLDLRWRAIRTHASQHTPYDAMSPELARAFLATDRLLRVDPPWTGGELERDWIPSPFRDE
jgi:N-acetyl-1-D-myo-inositol-2-amino-2-deoxy-alpha-D-glucopyranoside deacetylase